MVTPYARSRVGRRSEEIKNQDQRVAVADITDPVRGAAVEEQRIAFFQDDRLFLDLVFEPALQHVFTFKGIRADHLSPDGLFFQLEQYDVGCLGGDAAGEDALVGKAFYGLLGKMAFFSFPDQEDMVLRMPI